jgi:NADPH-dependent ferric siderophore reductase
MLGAGDEREPGADAMLVKPNYMLEKPPGPSQPKLFLDQTVIPALANAAGAVEGGVERAVVAARRDPILVFVLLAGAGLALTAWRASRRA